MTARYTAVLDRIEDDEHAVLLLEEDGETVDERVVDVDALPADGRRENAVFDIEVDGRDILDVEYLPETTERRLEAARERFQRLSQPLSEANADDEE